MSPSHDALLPVPLSVSTDQHLNAFLQRWVVVGRGMDSTELRAALRSCLKLLVHQKHNYTVEEDWVLQVEEEASGSGDP